jgi:CheY-like chemotaxis protein
MHAIVLDTATDDVHLVRQVVRDLHYAPRVTHVRSGQELVRAVRAARPDIVFAPWDVPDMRFRRLRYALDGEGYDGVLAALAPSADQDRAIGAGATVALPRPLCTATLRRAVHHYLMAYEGPAPEDVEDSWSIAIRRPFALGFTPDPIDVAKPGTIWMAEYGRENGPIEALALLDEALGYRLGAAVSLLPPGVANESLRRRAATERLCGNLRMLCELLTDLYDGRDLSLRALRRTTYLPRPLRRRATEGVRLDLQVDVKDYGRGRAAFVALAA